jgi:hypothetical protein
LFFFCFVVFFVSSFSVLCSMLPMNVSGLSILAQCCPWMSLDCPFLLNVTHECLWIVHSCSMLPMNVSGLSILAQCCPWMSLDCSFFLTHSIFSNVYFSRKRLNEELL